MSEIPFLITQQIIALQNSNWKNAIDYVTQIQSLYEKTAEQINQAITQQFPQKI